jgi:hypothetical protein
MEKDVKPDPEDPKPDEFIERPRIKPEIYIARPHLDRAPDDPKEKTPPKR